MKVFWKLRPIFDTHHAQESQISWVALFFLLLFSSFIFLFFFSRQNWLLPRTPLFWPFLPFFRCGFTRFRVFLLLQRHRKQTIKLNVWESNDGDQNNEKRVPFVMSIQTELLFFSITKCTGKVRNRSKILHRKSDPIIIAMITSED